MKAYTRGQETFLYRVRSFVTSFVNLIFLSFFVTCLVYGFMIFWNLPEAAWAIQKDVWGHFLKDLNLQNVMGRVDHVLSYEEKFLKLLSPFFLEQAVIAGYIGIGLFLLFLVIFWFHGRNLLMETHQRGAKLLSEVEFSYAIRSAIRRKIREEILDTPFLKRPFQLFSLRESHYIGKAFKINSKLWLPEFALNRHLGALGASGTGKTTLIKRYLDHCRKNGDKVLIVDVNGEYASYYKRSDDIVLSLYDKRSASWSFAGENQVLPNDFAKFLVPSTNEANAFFWKGARAVLSDLIQKTSDPKKLWELIAAGEEEITKNVSSFAQSIIGKAGSGQASGVIGSTLLELSFLKDLNYWPNQIKAGEPAFSLYDWVQSKDSRCVFITSSDTDQEIMRPLIRIWANVAILGLLQRPLLGVKELPAFNLVIDELSSVGKIELLPKAIDRARKYGGRIFLGYQSDHQLMDTYGRDAGAALKAGFGNRFIFRTTEPKEIRELSDFLGRVELREKNESQSFGLKNASERESISQHDVVKNVVLDSEIKQLPDFHFFLSCLNLNPVRSRLNKKEETLIDNGYEFYASYPERNACETIFLDKEMLVTDKASECNQSYSLVDEL